MFSIACQTESKGCTGDETKTMHQHQFLAHSWKKHGSSGSDHFDTISGTFMYILTFGVKRRHFGRLKIYFPDLKNNNNREGAWKIDRVSQ